MRIYNTGMPVMTLTVVKSGLAKSKGGIGVKYALHLNWGPQGGAIEVARGSRSEMAALRDAYTLAMSPTRAECYDLLRKVNDYLRAAANQQGAA